MARPPRGRRARGMVSAKRGGDHANRGADARWRNPVAYRGGTCAHRGQVRTAAPMVGPEPPPRHVDDVVELSAHRRRRARATTMRFSVATGLAIVMAEYRRQPLWPVSTGEPPPRSYRP